MDYRLQASPVTATLNILNQRWTLHIVRGLLNGKMRFNEMVRGHGINPCTLRDRLRELEKRGIIHRQVISAMPPNVEYSLTDKGMALHEIFVALENWGKTWMTDEEFESAS
jgi:DNA-binding HxlR family transcriptional regulator